MMDDNLEKFRNRIRVESVSSVQNFVDFQNEYEN